MTYQVALGYNNEAELADVVVQPRMQGIANGRRQQVFNGLLFQDGFQNCQLVYDYLTPANLALLLTQFGITTDISAEVTIRLPINYDRSEANFNAIVVRPDFPSDGEFTRTKWLTITFDVTRIEAIEV